MTKSTLKDASKHLFEEVRKLEVRFDDYLKEEEVFDTNLRNCIAQLKSLHSFIEKLEANSGTKEFETLELENASEEALSKALSQQAEAEHERSHLFKSYGALILALRKIEDNLVRDDAKKRANNT